VPTFVTYEKLHEQGHERGAPPAHRSQQAIIPEAALSHRGNIGPAAKP
jgi:hypothetical protein